MGGFKSASTPLDQYFRDGSTKRHILPRPANMKPGNRIEKHYVVEEGKSGTWLAMRALPRSPSALSKRKCLPLPLKSNANEWGKKASL